MPGAAASIDRLLQRRLLQRRLLLAAGVLELGHCCKKPAAAFVYVYFGSPSPRRARGAWVDRRTPVRSCASKRLTQSNSADRPLPRD